MTKDYPNVRAVAFEGLLVDFAKEMQANVVVRGLRAVTDFEYEIQIAQTNKVEYPDLETIFLTTSLQLFLFEFHDCQRVRVLRRGYFQICPGADYSKDTGEISSIIKEKIMASRIEEIIEEIEDYIDSCKPSAFSSSKIVVNRDELEGLLEELRTKTPG